MRRKRTRRTDRRQPRKLPGTAHLAAAVLLGVLITPWAVAASAFAAILDPPWHFTTCKPRRPTKARRRRRPPTRAH